MVTSMTGYGYCSVDEASYSVTAEIRSVNHRFLETAVFLPRPFMAFESQLKRLVEQYISRGKVDVYFSIEGEGIYEKGLHIHWRLLEQYSQALEQARTHLSLSDELRAVDLMQLPDVTSVTEEAADNGQVQDGLYRAVRGALQQVSEMRKIEGEHLKMDLERRLANIGSSVEKLTEYAPTVAARYRDRLMERIQAFLGDRVELDEPRMMNEVAVYADKINVEEELTRLSSHINQFYKYLQAGEANGKKLNFLQQEMNREMNTIGAKANHIDISTEIVEAKSELESIREQVQNIE